MDTLTTENLTGINREGNYANTPLKYLAASSIIGDDVKNAEGEGMGEIKDIMIDIAAGKIDYAIIEFGGFLGIGSKFFAIPFGLLSVDAVEKSFVFKQSKETLENAPGFDQDHWPDTNSHWERVYNYWNFVGY
ncbi:PRC-barrel domain-containing protein [Parasediminibacterium sp. JCM 36343]|uniref:PRC-barrel domain-containing protein n=1 Tax=Parasediminibacterium sp. JCM 36343 TaxID=3374279 RepID=UPI00397B1E40